MKNSVASADVREESVSQALALRGTLYKTGDVYDVEESGNFAVMKVRSN